jgi:hypothetical protein
MLPARTTFCAYSGVTCRDRLGGARNGAINRRKICVKKALLVNAFMILALIYVHAALRLAA